MARAAGPSSPARRPSPPSWLATAAAGVLAFWAAFTMGSAAMRRGGGGATAATARSTAGGGGASPLQLAGRAQPAAPPPICDPRPNTDYWGDVLVAGPDHLTPTAASCCAACGAHAAAAAATGAYGALPCNVWVWCDPAQPACGPAAGQCWLKHLPAAGAVPPRTGPGVPFTAGVTSPRAHAGAITSTAPASVAAYHTVITAAGPAVHWQSRVHYWWWARVRAECDRAAAGPGGPPCHMGGFTRVLHSGSPDDLMDEIPTFVAQPLEAGGGGGGGEEADAGSGARARAKKGAGAGTGGRAARPSGRPGGGDGGYVVLNRPWAIVQWMRAARPPEPFVLMAEPDHLWLAPLPNPLFLSSPATGGGGGGGGGGHGHGHAYTPPHSSSAPPRLAAYPFFYIEPASAPHLPVTAHFFAPETPGAPPFTPELAAAIPPIGNAPSILSTADLAALAPAWDATARRVFDYPPSRAAWGWVLEMYAFAIAAVAEGLVSPSRPAALFPGLMAQPPWEAPGVPFPGPGTYLLHYTYALDYDANGTATPGKRADVAGGKGWRFDKRDWASAPPPAAGLPLPPAAFNDGAARRVVEMINEATAALPGWDAYAAEAAAAAAAARQQIV